MHEFVFPKYVGTKAKYAHTWFSDHNSLTGRVWTIGIPDDLSGIQIVTVLQSGHCNFKHYIFCIESNFSSLSLRRKLYDVIRATKI